jgi:hypothetical protein
VQLIEAVVAPANVPRSRMIDARGVRGVRGGELRYFWAQQGHRE